MSENKEKKRKCGKFRSLTKTNCPVLLNPVPFFIKIKKKFIQCFSEVCELFIFLLDNRVYWNLMQNSLPFFSRILNEKIQRCCRNDIECELQQYHFWYEFSWKLVNMNFLENLWGIRFFIKYRKSSTWGNLMFRSLVSRIIRKKTLQLALNGEQMNFYILLETNLHYTRILSHVFLLLYTEIFESYFCKRHNKYKLPLVLPGFHKKNIFFAKIQGFFSLRMRKQQIHDWKFSLTLTASLLCRV
jgi:hypothetical protein